MALTVKAMPRSTHRQRYAVFLAQLCEARLRAGMTQVEIAQRLASTQTFVSKCERGERRLDVVDLIDFLDAYGVASVGFVEELHKKLRAEGTPRGSTAQRSRTGRK